MNILLVAATPMEIAPTIQWLEQNGELSGERTFQIGGASVELLITGIGLFATGYRLGARLSQNHPNLVVNAGIAGTFDQNLPIGEVVCVVQEQFADLGAETRDGQLLDLFTLGMLDANEAPFERGILNCNILEGFSFLPKVKGISANTASGSVSTIEKIQKKHPDAQVETMEGAAFFYACLDQKVNFIAIRAISNRVEPRNREAWNLPLSVMNLNEVLIKMIQSAVPG
jgi:futalosine hydrolase